MRKDIRANDVARKKKQEEAKMKKAGMWLLAVCLLLCMTGCGSMNATQTNDVDQQNGVNQQNGVQQNVSEDEPTEIALTVDNIGDYLTISSDVHDCTKKNVGGVWSAEGKLTVKSSPKKRGDFNGVVIKVAENRTGKGWEDYATERTLEIPFDGKFEQTFDIWGYVFDDSFISSSPVITLEIISVSGTFVEP